MIYLSEDMESNWIKKFIGDSKDLVEKPPYLFFVFISAIFVLVSLLSQNHFYEIWIFFLYSVVGHIWRYIEKDIRKNVLRSEWLKIASAIFYHLINLIILFFLLLLEYLSLIQ
jgi:hypothetical protein